MMKAKELEDPASCFNRARPDELMFVLLARDRVAPLAIRFWCKERIRLGWNQEYDLQIAEAWALADAIESEQVFSARQHEHAKGKRGAPQRA